MKTKILKSLNILFISNQIVDDILESLKVEIEKREIKVICDLTPQTYLANHQHVQQLMNNLINNAVKYNKQKGNLNIHS